MPHSLKKRKIAKYFPLADGQYRVQPGLFSLTQEFGNGKQDNRIFQIDQNYQQYRQNKISARNEQLNKYYCWANFSDPIRQNITHYLINTLCQEYPEFFSLEKKTQSRLFKNQLTQETFLINHDYDLLNPHSSVYSNLLDAIMMQVQEDIAIISEDNYISCLHLMSPNFWAASDKIGKSFNELHKDVAGIDKITKNSNAILQAMIYKGPYVRFAWGLTTDNQLNHHPAHAINNSTNNGRHFNPRKPTLYLRVERQTITGLPKVRSALFTIRSYLYDVKLLNSVEIQCLTSAINSMSNKQLQYKGLNRSKSAIIKWLGTLIVQ